MGSDPPAAASASSKTPLTAFAADYLGPDAATVGPQYGLLRPATQGGDLIAPHIIGIHGLVLLAVPAVLLAGHRGDRRAEICCAIAGRAEEPPRVAVGARPMLADSADR